jgi:hypothetical protein
VKKRSHSVNLFETSTEVVKQFCSVKYIEGENGAAKTFDWGTRVRVVLEAAQGELQ